MGLHLHHDGLSRPLANPRLRVLSLGAGVQSSWLIHAADRGLIGPKPDVAIMGDTMREPWWVYDYLDHLRATVSIPIILTSKGDLGERVMTKRNAAIPAFVAGVDGKPAPLNRSCTRDYKISAVEAAIRARLGLTGKRAPKTPIVELWIGISTDEITRLKVSRAPWILHRFPALEARRSREGCIADMEAWGVRVPRKSACTFCPYHDDAAWREMRDDAPSWAEALAADAALRDPSIPRTGTRAMYLHRSLRPLAEAPIDDPDDGSAIRFGFANECEGMCGV